MMNKTKVAIIGIVGLPAKYGGFETLAEHLVEELSDDFDFTVYCSSKRYTKEERQHYYQGALLKYIPLDANGIQSIPYDTLAILHAIFKSDVLLILGVAGAWLLPVVKWFSRKKIIISIDGIEWKRNKWSFWAKKYLKWAEKMAVNFSHIDITDNESIQDYTATQYKTLSSVIEYGADHTLIQVKPNQQDLKKYPFLNEDYAVKVCRIEPENNVHVVLKAFADIPFSQLVIVGNWNNSDYGKKLKSKYRRFPNIYMFDPIYIQREIDLIRGNAKIYIHGHSAGGTNPSLVEAMYLKLPVFAFDVSYNRVTTEEKAFYFNDSESLKFLLKVSDDYSLFHCADQMRKIAERRYKWKKIAQKYSILMRDSFKVRGKISPFSNVSQLKKNILTKHHVSHLQNNKVFDE